MDMQGHRHLAVTQQQAWDALNDPEVLKACIPGCDKVEPTGPGQYAIAMAVRIGPVSARFQGKITLADVQPPDSYTLAFEGQGGAAGFGKGSARVSLSATPEQSGCELDYSATAQVGGKIAQVGQRLVDGVARSMAEDFFRRFDEEMKRRHPEAYEAEAAQALLAEVEGDADPAMPGAAAPVDGAALAGAATMVGAAGTTDAGAAGAGVAAAAARSPEGPARSGMPTWGWIAVAVAIAVVVALAMGG